MVAKVLKNVFMFAEMSDLELEQICKIATTQTLGKGELVFSEGSESKAMFFLNYGSARIHQMAPNGEEIQLGMIGTGSHLGEMGFIDGERRSATAELLERSEVIRISYEDLRNLFKAQPLIGARFHRAVSKFLAGRLRATTHELSSAREKKLSHG